MTWWEIPENVPQTQFDPQMWVKQSLDGPETVAHYDQEEIDNYRKED